MFMYIRDGQTVNTGCQVSNFCFFVFVLIIFDVWKFPVMNKVCVYLSVQLFLFSSFRALTLVNNLALESSVEESTFRNRISLKRGTQRGLQMAEGPVLLGRSDDRTHTMDG